jgi:pimeloyl-ACP methyl ester carboxylesterase
MADDVARFMWENKISTATLAGHGIGGKLALAVGCYHAERVTGIMALDTAPMNQHYIESYQELNSYLSELRHFNTNRSLTNISNDLKKIKCPKWRELFQDNLVKSPQGFTWNFNQNHGSMGRQNYVRLPRTFTIRLSKYSHFANAKCMHATAGLP